MDWLESVKKSKKDNEAITNDTVAQAYLENYAHKLFSFADQQDRASNFGKNVVKAFYTSAMVRTLRLLQVRQRLEHKFLPALRHHHNFRWIERGSHSVSEIFKVEGRIHSQLLEERRDTATGSTPNWRRRLFARCCSRWEPFASSSDHRNGMEHESDPADSIWAANYAFIARDTSKHCKSPFQLAGSTERARTKESRRFHSLQPLIVKFAVVRADLNGITRSHSGTNWKGSEVLQICDERFKLRRRSDGNSKSAEVSETFANRRRLLNGILLFADQNFYLLKINLASQAPNLL